MISNDDVCLRNFLTPRPLQTDVVADVRIFFNAGWRLNFSLILDRPFDLSYRQTPFTIPIVNLTLHTTCDTDDLIFRELRPRRIEEDSNIGSVRLEFDDFVNHMFEDDRYDHWKTLYAAMDRTTKVKNQSGAFGKWIPFNTRDSQMTLQICYFDELNPGASANVGAVHFVLTPSDGLEFVVFAIIALVGIPMLLMIGFRCVASKHAFLRQHIVKCVTTNRLFTQQLIHWLNLHDTGNTGIALDD